MENMDGKKVYDLTGLKWFFILWIAIGPVYTIVSMLSKTAPIVALIFDLAITIACMVIWYKGFKGLKEYSAHFGKVFPLMIAFFASFVVLAIVEIVCMARYMIAPALIAVGICGLIIIMFGLMYSREYCLGLAEITEKAGDTRLRDRSMLYLRMMIIGALAGVVIGTLFIIVFYRETVYYSDSFVGTKILTAAMVCFAIYSVFVNVFGLYCTWQVYSRYHGMPLDIKVDDIGTTRGEQTGVGTGASELAGKAGNAFGSLLHSASDGIHAAANSIHKKSDGGKTGREPAQNAQKFCTMCGKPLQPDTRYCEYCGTRIEGR